MMQPAKKQPPKRTVEVRIVSPDRSGLNSEIYLDGRNMSDAVRAVTVRLGVGELNRVDIELIGSSLTFKGVAEVHVWEPEPTPDDLDAP